MAARSKNYRSKNTSFYRLRVQKLPQKVRFYLSLAFLAALLLGGLWWLSQHHWDWEEALDALRDPGTPVSTGFVGSGIETYSTADTVLDTLQVRERVDGTGYSRDLYGKAWADIDRNGCDQRNDILARDLHNVKRAENNCQVLSGELTDPYTGDRIEFTRGSTSSQAIPIDHVVALSNAWQTGATLLSESQRAALANDPLNLQATDRTANTVKSDSDAAQWLPQPGYRCEYVARQVSVKAAYNLWVTPAEKKAMHQVLDTCPEQPAYRSPIVH